MNLSFGKYGEGFSYFYSQIGNRVFISLLLSFIVGLLDGLGLTMFLPLLQVVDSGGEINASELGKLQFLITFIKQLDINLTLLTVLIIMCMFFALKGIAVFIQFYYRTYLQEMFVRNLRINNIRGLNNLAYKHFLKADTGRIQNTLGGEVDRVSKAYQSYFQIIQGMIMVIIYLVFAFFVHAQFALLVTAGGILTNLIYRRIYVRTKGTSRKLTAESHDFQGLILQYLGNFKYLKATGNLFKYGKKLEDTATSIEANNRKIGVLMAILNATREPLIIIVVCLIIYIQTGVWGSPLGPILISLLFFYRALTFLMQTQMHLNFYLSVSGSLTNMKEFSDELTASRQVFGNSGFDKFKDQVKIENGVVNFGERRVLNKINLSINHNDTIAFVGESGGGKTTLINVISGLLPLDQGKYSIDSVDSVDINIAEFQSRVGYISQEPVIFNDTIFNNVTFWAERTDGNVDHFKKCLHQAAAFQFVNELEQKEETLLGVNGMNLSGGQRQRISIARELYKQVDILILDEATSALDSQTENEIRENVELLKGSLTLIIVAHRLSTVRYADKIFLIKEGSIMESGTFTELVAKSEEFNNMVKLQELQRN